MKNPLKKFSLLTILVLSTLLGGCKQTPPGTTPVSSLPTSSLPAPAVRKTAAPDPGSAARAFLEAWKTADYPAMYARLTADSRKAITEEAFSQVFQNVAIEAALSGLDYNITTPEIDNPLSAQVHYQVTLHSSVVGDIVRETQMDLHNENGGWRVAWDPAIVMPDLAGNHVLKMDAEIPDRGNLYDRNGKPLASRADATAIGLYPANIDPEQEENLLVLLSRVTGLRIETITGMYVDKDLSQIGYLPLAEVPTDSQPNLLRALSGYSGVVVSDYSSRFYPEGGVGPHVVGYVSQINADELAEYRQRGYRGDEFVGRKGLERWGEPYLAGKPGGTLYVVDDQGKPVSQIGQVASQPAQEITTTLESDLQVGVQQAINGFRGAAVVLERDTGRVLAMASSPGFDPNAWQTANQNWDSLISQIASNPNQPEYNRATMGLYPLGSVFKIITMAAGLNSGFFTPDTIYDCQYEFTEAPGLVRYDWTWDHFQQDGVTQPTGKITLVQGLMRSCNPYFWHIGYNLYTRGLTKAVSDMARAFGLGSATGITGVEEQGGNVPDPSEAVDAINLAIGQGNLQVTPLQVADFVAAVGNGGTLYRPQVIEQIAPPNTPAGGTSTFVFKPEERGKLPISAEMLQAIQEGMMGVVKSRSPRGTAYNTFQGFNIPVAGKTGTATSQTDTPHAWFAGYTYAGNPDRPDIAIAVILENQGEGSDWAAPVFRRIAEIYFFGRPIRPYRWESSIGVTRTPTPEVTDTETPVPEEEVTPSPE